MKKLLLFLLLGLFFANVNAQCVPDPSYTSPGMYPDSATGIAPAHVGVHYEEVITVVLPTDTTINFPSLGPVALTINSLSIDSIKAISETGDTIALSEINFTYNNAVIQGGTSGCIGISGDPQYPIYYVYPLVFYTKMNVTHQLLGTFDAPQTLITHYILNIGTPLDVITGKVYNDLNANCVKDVGEPGLVSRLVVANPGNHYTYTNAQGDYTIGLTSVGTYIISHSPALYWNGICPQPNQSYSVTVDTTDLLLSGNDFGDTLLTNINDLQVILTNVTVARPGFPVSYYIAIINVGTTTRTGTLTLNHDNQLSFVSANPAEQSHTGNILTWNYGPLAPGTSVSYSTNFVLSQTAVLGTFLHMDANAEPIAEDETPADNVDSLDQIVQGSFDPNDKAVIPASHISQTMVANQIPLTYTIRFQNTGTDTAFTVVIRDTLSQDLAMETFQVLSSSHPVTWEVSDPQKMTFTFANILLPDSNVNEPGSHGFVKYRIRPKTSLALGETVDNTAYIYFDFNQPVVTNTVSTLVSNEGVSIAENSSNESGLAIYPNPANSAVTVISELQDGLYQLNDITGKLILSGKATSEKFSLDISQLNSGIYFITVVNAVKEVRGKLVKQ